MLKTIILATLGAVAIVGGAKAQSFTLTVDAGYLRTNAAGNVNEPIGGLLQLIASPSGTFSTPTSSSFVSGDNVLLTSFAMNYGGGTGEVIQGANSYSFTTNNYTVTSGEALELRFYPTITYSNVQNYYATGPGTNAAYGQVRSNSVEFSSDSSETPWVVPAAGAAKDITYITAADSGTYPDGPNGTGISSFATFTTAVPEPSTGALFGCGVIALAAFRTRLHRLFMRG